MCWCFTSSEVQKFLALEREGNHSHFYLSLVFVPQDVERRQSNASGLDPICRRHFNRLAWTLNTLYIWKQQWTLQMSIAAKHIVKCDFPSIQVLFDQFAMAPSLLHGGAVLQVLLQSLILPWHQYSTLSYYKSVISCLYDSHFLSWALSVYSQTFSDFLQISRWEEKKNLITCKYQWMKHLSHSKFWRCKDNPGILLTSLKF